MAGAGGFEPPNAGIKSPCLAAWRRPNKKLAGLFVTNPKTDGQLTAGWIALQNLS